MPQPRRLAHMLLALLLALTAAWAPAALRAQEQGDASRQVVRVGVYNTAPLFFMQDGQAKGLTIDLLRDVAEREGWTLVFVPGSWDECLERLQRGEIDLLPNITKTPEREAELRFSREYLLLNWGVVYRKKGAPIRTVFDLQGRTIAALRGSTFTDDLKALLDQFGVKAYIVLKPEYAEVMASVARGDASAGVCPNLLGGILEAQYAVEATDVVFSPSKIRTAVKRGGREDLLPALDQRLAELKAQPGSLYYQLREKWLGRAGKPAAHGWLLWALGAALAGLVLLGAFAFFLRLLVLRRTADLAASETALRSYIDNAPDGVFILDENGRFVDVNPAGCQLTGYSRDEVLSMGIPEIMGPDLAEIGMRLFAEQHATGRVTGAFPFRRKDGELRHLSLSAVTLSGARTLSFLKDVTLARKAEEALRESEQHYRTLADSGQALVWTSTPDKLCDYFNAPWLAFTGRSLEQELGNGWAEGVHPDDLERCLDIYVAAFDARQSFSMEYRLRHHSGAYRWIVDQGTPRYGAGGEFLGYIGHCLDISERKRVEEALRQNQEFTRAVMENLTIGIAVNSVDPAVSFTYMNENFHKLYRTTREQLARPDAFWEAVYEDPDFRAEIRERVLADCASGDSARMYWADVPITRRGGPTTYVSARNVPLPELGLMISTVWDVTHRVLAEKALKQSNERLQTTLRTAVDGILRADVAGRVQDVNEAYCRMSGYSREELLGLAIADLEAVGSADEVRKRTQALKERGRDRFESRHRRKDGSVFDVEVSVTYQDTEGGWFVAFLRDITERKRAEEALKNSEARFRSVADTAVDAIITIDTAGRITFFNEAAARLFGYAATEATGMPVTRLMPEAFRPAHTEALKRFAETGQATSLGQAVERTGLRKDGGQFPLELSVSAWRTAEGMYLTGILRDITERRQAEQALLAAKDAAEAANRAKSEFLANMSHELRTPMNGVLGMLQLLQLEELKPSQRNYAHNAIEAANRLLSLLNDILDFSRIEAGVLAFKHEPFRPADLLAATEGVFSHICARKGLALDIAPDAGLPTVLVGDEARIRQIVFNLVGNAVKFTRQGGVRVEAWHRAQAGDAPGRLLVAVSDTGVGIPEARLHSVFDRFSQADASYTRQFEGAGLGLAIVRRIVESLGGTLCIESEEGAGTSVVLSLPTPTAPAELLSARADSEPGEAEETTPLRILLAEDELIGQLGARLMLERMGHRVVAVGNGRDAVEAALTQEFDCVLMDIQMPEMDGLEATRILRNTTLPGQPGHMPIIAMTAYALSGDREKFLAAGMDEYISKPFRQGDLRALLQSVARSRRKGGRRD